MDLNELKKILRAGEDSSHQFKENVTNVDSLASEMVAFSNSNGGQIFIGLSDKGKLKGIPLQEVSRINQLISNAASQHMKSPISPITENVLIDDNQSSPPLLKKFQIEFPHLLAKKRCVSAQDYGQTIKMEGILFGIFNLQPTPKVMSYG